MSLTLIFLMGATVGIGVSSVTIIITDLWTRDRARRRELGPMASPPRWADNRPRLRIVALDGHRVTPIGGHHVRPGPPEAA